jgi:hypothetical protein
MAARNLLRSTSASWLHIVAVVLPGALASCGGCGRPAPPARKVEVPGGGKPVLTAAERPANPSKTGEVAPVSFEEPQPLAISVTVKPLAEWTEQETSMDALGRIGAPAVPALVQVLENGDGATRLKVVETLGRMGEDAKEAVPALIRLLDDADPDVRKAATRSLGRIGPAASDAVPALVRRLLEPEPQAAASASATAPPNGGP